VTVIIAVCYLDSANLAKAKQLTESECYMRMARLQEESSTFFGAGFFCKKVL